MKKQIMLIFLVMIFLTLACRMGQKPDVNEDFEITQTVLDNVTATSTMTPSAIPTDTPTITPTNTNTNTPTFTATYTPTQLPSGTLTKMAIEATQTKKASFITATQIAKNNEKTAVAYAKTNVAKVKGATATEIASYDKTISWKEISTYAENYKGKKVSYKGRIFNIIGDVVQIYFSGTYEALYVELKEPPSGIYENDSITVYGVVYGNYCFTNAMNSEVCQPAIFNAWYTKP